MSKVQKVEELNNEIAETLTMITEELQEIDSPIEQIFYASLMKHYLSDSIMNPMMQYSLSVNLQVDLEIGVKKYKPDFEIMMFQIIEIDGKDTHREFSCYVECDGHDFHERTKEQAKNDRSKDRAFMNEGLKLIRFTGSEIYNSHQECVKEVINFMYKNLKDLDFKIM